MNVKSTRRAQKRAFSGALAVAAGAMLVASASMPSAAAGVSAQSSDATDRAASAARAVLNGSAEVRGATSG